MSDKAAAAMPPSRKPHDAGAAKHSAALEAELQHWSAKRIAIVATLWVLGAIAMVVLSVFAHQYHSFPGDLRIAEWVQQLHQQTLVRFINFASDANWPTPAGIVAIAVILALAITHHFRAAIAAAVAGFGADFVNVTINGIVGRPRPNNVHIHAVGHVGLHSYPSGHVTHVIAFYGFLLYLMIGASRAYPRWRPALKVIQVICLYFIIFIGPSRVLEGEHWPSDVVASYLLGALMLVVGIAVFHLLGLAALRMQQRRAARQGGGRADTLDLTPSVSA